MQQGQKRTKVLSTSGGTQVKGMKTIQNTLVSKGMHN